MKTTLPLALSGFVGREREVDEVRRLVLGERLVTLYGPGGVGKTRLALRAAESTGDAFGDGVRFVELATLLDVRLVPQAVAATLELGEQGSQSVTARLIEALRTQQMLLILDNCEHLVQGCAELAEALLRGAAGLRVLVTSREPLGVPGETIWAVPPLSEADAVALFRARAQSVQADVEADAAAVRDVCRRLDGLPLAIELAAARTRFLSVEDVAARLDDRFRLLTSGSRTAPPRQQTLRATLQWSYDLLSESEQLLFDRLSIFAGTWTLSAAEHICARGAVQADQVLELVGLLVDRSLVTPVADRGGPRRYRLLENMAHFGQERLRERAEAEQLAKAHAAFFVKFAVQAAARFLGPGEPEAVTSLEAEHDNLRAALRFLMASGDTEGALRLSAALGLFWFFISGLSEGRGWLDTVLALPDAQTSTRERAKCLFAAANISMAQGDYATSKARAEDALRLAQTLGDNRQAAAALFMVGQMSRVVEDERGAEPLLEQAISLARETGNTYYESLALVGLADSATYRGELVRALELATAGRDRALEVGRPRIIVHALRSLADAYFESGNLEAARHVAEESVADDYGTGLSAWWSARLLTTAKVAVARRDIGVAQARLADVLRLSAGIGNRAGVTSGLEVAAYLAAVQRQSRRALVLLAAAERLHESLGREMLLPVGRRVRREIDAALSAAHLTEKERRAAQQEGQLLEIDAAIAYALDWDAASRAGAPATPADVLTPREREVAWLVVRGLSNREIAERLVLTQKTAANHVARIFDKLGVRSRAQLVARADELGLRTHPSPLPEGEGPGRELR